MLELISSQHLTALFQVIMIDLVLAGDNAIVTLLFGVAAVTAGFALLCRGDRFRVMWFDLAGSLTFIGVVISVLIEPDQVIRLFALSDQPE